MKTPLLLVEDTPSLSLVYETVLKRAGHDVNTVPTIAQAEDALNLTEHTIILLDLTLPDGDGLDLMTRILRNNPNTKVIVITANGSINRAVEAMRGGAFDFLVKPFDEHRLLAAVENAMEESRQVTQWCAISANRQLRYSSPATAAPEKKFAPRRSIRSAIAPNGHLSLSTVAPFPKIFWNRRFLVTYVGHSQVQSPTKRALLLPQMAELCSWTKFAKWTLACKPSSCVFCKPLQSNPSVPQRRASLTFGSFAPRTGIQPKK